MGHNVDFVELLGLPNKTSCHTCGRTIDTNFDDYDIDCGDPTAKTNDKLTLDCYCHHCKHDFKMVFDVLEVKDSDTAIRLSDHRECIKSALKQLIDMETEILALEKENQELKEKLK